MPDSAEGSDEHLRIGVQDEILMYNRQVDDATLPDLSPAGVATSVALPTGAWECFEYYLGTDGSIATWLNSNAIAGLTTAASKANNDQWESTLIIPKITGVYFGWESYGSDPNTFWYDDIVVNTSRVGCGSSVSSVSGGQDRLFARVHIHARFLARITHSVCEVMLGFWKGEGETSGGLGGKLQTLFCKVIAEGRVLKGCQDLGGCIYDVEEYI
jgi:hypothetical protein